MKVTFINVLKLPYVGEIDIIIGRIWENIAKYSSSSGRAKLRPPPTRSAASNFRGKKAHRKTPQTATRPILVSFPFMSPVPLEHRPLCSCVAARV